MRQIRSEHKYDPPNRTPSHRTRPGGDRNTGRIRFHVDHTRRRPLPAATRRGWSRCREPSGFHATSLFQALSDDGCSKPTNSVFQTHVSRRTSHNGSEPSRRDAFEMPANGTMPESEGRNSSIDEIQRNLAGAASFPGHERENRPK